MLIDAPSLSPRLAWLDRHRVMVRHATLPHTFVPCDQTKEWLCANHAMTTVGFGNDELEATLDFAQRNGVKHWLVEDWEIRSSGIRRPEFVVAPDPEQLAIRGEISVLAGVAQLEDLDD